MLTRIPNGDDGKLPLAVGLAFLALVGTGLANGVIVNMIGITPIVTTLGMNALLFGAVIFISGGTPRDTTAALQSLITDPVLGVGRGVFIAIVCLIVLAIIVKRTSVGRRFEAVGANRAAARAAGFPSTRFEIAAYVGAGLMYFIGSVLLAGVVKTPSAFQGNNYLLPSVAAVVLGGTSLLGGPGSVIATAGGALFLTQLQQLLRTTDLNAGVVLLVQAAAIAVGVAVHSVRRDVLARFVVLPARRRKQPS
jgi:ribose transport system permease protein